jgi:hypothetical protein
MGIFGEVECDGEAETSSRRGKPDYKKLIQIQQAKNIASINLKSMLLSYLDTYELYNARRINDLFTLSSLIGYLELEIRNGYNVEVELAKQQK